GAGTARLVLGEGLVAVLSPADAAPDAETITLWASDGPLDVTVEASLPTLTLLNPTGAAAPWSVAVVPVAPQAAAGPNPGSVGPGVLAAGRSVEDVALSAGVTRIAVQAAPGATLHVRGAATEAVWVGADGRVARGRDLRLGTTAGRVEVAHGAGAWMVWVDAFEGADAESLTGNPSRRPLDASGAGCAPASITGLGPAHSAGTQPASGCASADSVRDSRSGSEARVVWGGPPPAAPTTVTPVPSTVPLAKAVETIRVTVPGAGLLRVRAGQPVIALVRRDGGPATALRAFDGTVDVPIVAPPPSDSLQSPRGFAVATWGSVEVSVRAVGGGPLRGGAEVEFVAATALGEGIGAEALIGAGSGRTYAFTVERAGPVGVGVRVEGADVTVGLYGPDGAAVATGVAMMPTLAPGRHLLTASLPAGAAPARIRPALVGLAPPDTGPPEEVIRAYLVAAGLIPPAPSGGAPVDTDGADAAEDAE
ncbi:MAG: hypothetical protein Q8P41_09555, partial [Pseudomonadota bacterium]|nr:hypothetical protein [Pseudomonadota bacterium]